MTSRLLALAATLALLAGCASGGGKPSDEPSGGAQTLLELRAVVIEVDQQHRRVTLKTADEEILVLPVAEEFPDFDKLRLGDPVIVSYNTEEISRNVKPTDGGAAGITITTRITASIRRAPSSRWPI